MKKLPKFNSAQEARVEERYDVVRKNVITKPRLY